MFDASPRLDRRCAGRAPGRRPTLTLRPLVRAMALAPLAFGAPLALAQTLPTGMTVVHGQATVSTSGSAMTVTNSSGAILNWNSFSIGSGQSVRFQQPDANSQVLNRVTGNDPSAIFGSLSSNGKVWLLNPHGVLFGEGARVDVGGLVASTLSMADGDWLAARYHLGGGAATSAQVANEGRISTPMGGQVLLLGGAGGVRNSGLIEAPGGQVALAAGQSIDVVDGATPNIALQVTAPQGQALNLGTIDAAGGRMDVQAGIVNQEGILRADGLAAGPGGTIVLRSAAGTQLATGSVTSAQGAQGGTVTVDSASGQTLLDGTVSTAGANGAGGQVQLLGRQVGLTDHAIVIADGSTGGGTVLVGGGARGQDASVHNADATFIASSAVLSANATSRGDGGHIVAWSNDATRAYGRFSAEGGASGGNGGLVETSGGWLDARPSHLSVASHGGRAGEWLLDPNDILITDAISTDSNVSGAPNFTTTGDSALISTATINAALDSGANVTISTGSAAPNSQQGDITLRSASIFTQSSTPVSLALNAQHDIIFDTSSIGSETTPISVTLNAGLGGSGGIQASLGNVFTAGGDLTMSGFSFTAQSGSSFSTDTGRLTLRADSVQLLSSSGLSSNATGTSILVQGFSGPYVTSFANDSSSNLFVEGGRWLIYAAAPASITDGGLDYAFVAYGGTAPSSLPDPLNNGIVYGVSPTLALSASNAISKTYDQSTAISLAGAGLAVSGGQINGDQVTLSTTPTLLTGTFADANAGTGKAVTVNPAIVSAIDGQGRTVYGYQLGTVSGDILPRAVSVSGTSQNKVYDGTTSATIGSWAVSGVLTGDAVSATTVAAQFSDRNVGTGKAVAATAALTGAEASNYTIQSSSATPADITPRGLTLTGTSQSKVYDGTASATIGSWAVSGVVTGDTVGASTVNAQFSDPNVGTGKAVAATAALTGADASNYAIQSSSATPADITPATLTYVAQPATMFYGAALPALSGSVSGFVSGDTLASATTGTLGFTATAGAQSAPGSYAVTGAGLQANNYVFAQAASNASALTIEPALPNEAGSPSTALLAKAQHDAVPGAQGPGSSGQAVDAYPSLQPNPQQGTLTFTAMPVDQLGSDGVAQLLAARDDIKQSVFGSALDLLAQNPGLADLPACQTPEQVDTGDCLVTPALKRKIRAQGGVTGSLKAAVAPTPASPQPVPSAPSAVADAAKATAAALASAVPALPAPRAVKVAALPEIQRKFALVVGIDRYDDKRIPQLDNAVNDAHAIAGTFDASLGYEAVVLANPSRQTLVATLNRLALALQPQDSVVVYYAGHGELVPATKQGYWIPGNADSQNPRTWLSNSDIARLLGEFDASQVALISDSCYSGSLVGTRHVGPAATPLDPREVLSHKVTVAMSSGGNEPVADEGKQGHSPFAWSLMQSLGQLQGWQPGGNVFEHVRFAVARQLPQRPQYGAAAFAGDAQGGDYLFERRQLADRP